MLNETPRVDDSVTQVIPGANISVLSDLLRQGLKAGQVVYLTVSSGSMSPLLRAGDRVGVGQVELDHLQVGDVVVISQPDSLLTHRFYGLRHVQSQRRFMTRGDRVRYFDPLWHEEDLLGRVLLRQRGSHTLWLDQGRGRRLNQWLTKLAQLEQKSIGLEEPGAPIEQPLLKRLGRAALRAIATIMTLITEYTV